MKRTNRPANQEIGYMQRTNRTDQSGDSLHLEDKQARPIRRQLTSKGQTGQANQEIVFIQRTNRPGQSGESLYEEDKQAGQSGDRLHVEDKQARPIRHNITYRLPLYSINLAILKQIPFLKGFFFSFLIFDKFRLNKMTSSYRNLLRTCLKVKQNYI